MWSGDARDGFNGGGDFVRWLRDDRDRAAAAAFFRPRCDRVRVLPFLEGVPCSIHGFVLPDGTAVLRPVEIVTLRDPAARTMTYAGLGSTWDPPAADREAMRGAARRVGAHLQREHGYRGAFGVDGVLTADGFRPTELNTRMSAGATALSEVDRRFFTFLQAALVAGDGPGAHRGATSRRWCRRWTPPASARSVAFAEARRRTCPGELPGHLGRPVVRRAPRRRPATCSQVGSTPSGLFAKVEPCAAVVPGRRLAPVNAALCGSSTRRTAPRSGRWSPRPTCAAAT